MIEKMEKHRVFVEVFVKGKTCRWNSYQEIYGRIQRSYRTEQK